MNHRERALAALNHREPDRVPIDFGASRDTSIVLGGYEKLKQHLGVQSPNRITSVMMQCVDVDERIMDMLDVDFRPIYLGPPDDTKHHRALAPNSHVDEWGIERIKPEGGFYYDQLTYPLAGDVSVYDIVNYAWPDPQDKGYLKGIRDRALDLKRRSDCAIVLNLPPPFVHISQYLRGFEDWYIDIAVNPPLLSALFDAILEVNLEISRLALEQVGDHVDVIVTADDLGLQDRLMVPVDIYRKLIKPRHKRVFTLLREKSRAKIFFHTCGCVVPIIGDLIDIGVDILNPVQVSARGMDPKRLKEEFGKDLVFWGGIDTQEILPHGSPAQVGAEVGRMIDIMGRDGGFVLAAVHNIQPDVPVDNIMAMFDRAKNYRRGCAPTGLRAKSETDRREP